MFLQSGFMWGRPPLHALSEAEGAVPRSDAPLEPRLDFPPATPLGILLLWNVAQRIDQQTPQPVAAFEVGIHDFESDFIHSRTPQQDMRFDLCAHPHRDFQVGL